MRPSARNIAALTAGAAAMLLALLGVPDHPAATSVADVHAALEATRAFGERLFIARSSADRVRVAPFRAVSSLTEPFLAEERAPEQVQGLPIEPIEAHEEAEALAVGSASLFLFSLARAAGEPLASARGFDRGSPRDLTLWRVDALSGRAAPVARGVSEPDGSVHFDRLLVPASGARLVVTAAGSSPHDPGASSPLDLEARQPGPPPARVESIASGRWRLRADTVAGAALLIDGGGDGPPMRFPPPPSGAGVLPAARGVEAEFAAPSAGVLLVAQQLADGSITAWRPVPPPLEMIETQPAVEFPKRDRTP